MQIFLSFYLFALSESIRSWISQFQNNCLSSHESFFTLIWPVSHSQILLIYELLLQKQNFNRITEKGTLHQKQI